MIGDIIGGIIIPHVFAAFLLLRIGMWEVRPDKSNTVREDFARLWAWACARWHMMVMHPLYWAGTGLATAFFLIEPLRRLFV